jgi:hypothetical protein
MLPRREIRVILRVAPWLLSNRRGSMATKLVGKKPEIKKRPSPAAPAPKAQTAPSAMRVTAVHKKVAAARAPAVPKPSKTLAAAEQAQNRAETIQVIRDAKAGKNLVRYSSPEAMYEDLGVCLRILNRDTRE